MALQIPQRSFYATAANTPGLFDGALPQNRLLNQEADASQAFSGGIPTDASGNPDFAAMAKTLYQKGALQPANELLGVGIKQQAIQQGLAAANDLAGGNPAPQSAQGTGAMPIFQNAIASVESKGSGDYAAQGPVTSSGDRAYGKYQVMGANIPSWTKEILGQAMTPEQFATNPQAQDAVFNGKFGQYLRQTGNPRDAASMWFTGKPYAQGAGAQDQLGTTGAGYVQKFLAALPRGGQSQPAQGAASPPPVAQKNVQVAQNGASDASDAPTGSSHPYAPSAPAEQPPAARAPMQIGPGAASGTAVPVAPAPNPSNVPGQQAGVIDQTMGGLVPPQFASNPGGYVARLRSMAARLATLGNEGAASAYNKQADGIERGIERNGLITPEMKNYQVAVSQGFQGSAMDYTRAQEVQKLSATGDPSVIRAKGQAAEAEAAGAAQGKAPYEFHPSQDAPGAPITYQSTAQMAASPTPVVASQPKVFAQQQDALGKSVSAIPQQMMKRQVAQERLDAMSKLLETFQTGAGADQKAAAIAGARSLGFNIPDSATANATAVEQFGKNASANIFSQAGDLGGKVLVSELDGLKKANANPNMQPASNAAILGQQKGLLQWQDAHDQALMGWYKQNPYAVNSDDFDTQWMKTNPPSAYVAKAKLDIAALGAAVPAPQQRTTGQRYAIPGKGVFRWMGQGWSAN